MSVNFNSTFDFVQDLNQELQSKFNQLNTYARLNEEVLQEELNKKNGEIEDLKKEVNDLKEKVKEQESTISVTLSRSRKKKRRRIDLNANSSTNPNTNNSNSNSNNIDYSYSSINSSPVELLTTDQVNELLQKDERVVDVRNNVVVTKHMLQTLYPNHCVGNASL